MPDLYKAAEYFFSGMVMLAGMFDGQAGDALDSINPIFLT